MSNTLMINGKTYASLEEMPPDVRAQWDAMQNVFADKNQNGLPDIMDNLATAGATMIRSNTIVYDGKTYASADDLPPEARAKYEEAMRKLADENRAGVPELAPGAPPVAPVIMTTHVSAAPMRQLPPPAPTTNLGPVIVLGIVSIGLAIVVGILLFLVLNKT
ncbi:MAG: hypothetical protein IT331_20865 [Anaerolineae bacterium]|nr:hypothetical protein [Anaerolineae bacterium]